MPSKNIFAKVNLENSEFLEARRKHLNTFIQKLLNHRVLRYIDELKSFLCDQEK
jgi:sorting nexin-1/2